MYALQTMTTELVWANGLGWNSSTSALLASYATTSASHIPLLNKTQQTINILVGSQGRLEFDPDSATVALGSLLIFNFLASNHTLTQSSLRHPCSNGSEFDTGFNQVNPQNTSSKSVVEYLVTSSKPQWFFCAQGIPQSYCANGMVFSLNPAGLVNQSENNARLHYSHNETQPTASYCNSLYYSHTSSLVTKTGIVLSPMLQGPQKTSSVLETSNAGHVIKQNTLLVSLFTLVAASTILVTL
jgi:hypothetical protein